MKEKVIIIAPRGIAKQLKENYRKWLFDNDKEDKTTYIKCW